MSETPAATASLAVTHRPRAFLEIAGQRHVVAVLTGALRNPQPPAQILLSGPSGLGKTTLARLYAAALLCDEAPAGELCGRCSSCRDTISGSGAHPDVVELDAASSGGKDDVKELAMRSSLAPSRGAYRVYIIDEAHAISAAGSQAFLRLLEQPPSHVTFILCTTAPEKLPVALRGRCLTGELVPPAPADVATRLVTIAEREGWPVDMDTALRIVGASDPETGVRGAVGSLAKLAPVLRAGRRLRDEDLTQLSAALDPAVVTDLIEAIRAHDRRRVLSLYDSCGVPDRVLRRHLIDRTRELLRMASTATGLDTAIWWLETLLTAQGGAGHLEAALLALASPHLRPDPGAVLAATGRAEAVLARLEDALQHTRVEE